MPAPRGESDRWQVQTENWGSYQRAQNMYRVQYYVLV